MSISGSIDLGHFQACGAGRNLGLSRLCGGSWVRAMSVSIPRERNRDPESRSVRHGVRHALPRNLPAGPRRGITRRVTPLLPACLSCLMLLVTLTTSSAPAVATVFPDRQSFDAANPGLVVEGFEAGILNISFGSPLDSTSDNDAFSPGDILPGVAFANVPDDALSLVDGSDFPGLTSKTLIKSAESQGGAGSLDISFPAGTFAVGLDLYHTTGGTTGLIAAETTISWFGSSGLLDSIVLNTSASGPVFLGVSETEIIERVNVDGVVPGFFSFEMIDNVAFNPAVLPPAASLVASVLPGSRSVQLGSTASAFATIINAGNVDATSCDISPLSVVPGGFVYQTTDPATNALTGTPDTPADIPAGGLQSFLFAFTPTSEIAPTDVQLSYDCTNSAPAPVVPGVNTLLLSSSSTPVPDIVALATTPTGDGIVDLPGSLGANAFAVASVNVGSQDTITASADTGTASLAVTLSICESNPATGECLSAPAASVTTLINAGATPTFSIFVTGTGTVPFDPASNRIFVRFRDAGGVTRGSTSVAVQTL
jgi:hypothetical protein